MQLFRAALNCGARCSEVNDPHAHACHPHKWSFFLEGQDFDTQNLSLALRMPPEPQCKLQSLGVWFPFFVLPCMQGTESLTL